ncbi:MAG: PEP-CTERM sorting domain-containing protein [Opitutales bacterium]|nr:PEP-CTERM sorting domain-containing protein [Opitutales bacterium]
MKRPLLYNKKHVVALASCAAFAAAVAVHGQGLLAYEGFGYSGSASDGDPIAGLNVANSTGATGFSGSWTVTRQPQHSNGNSAWRAQGLGYTDRNGNVLPTTPGSAYIAAAPNTAPDGAPNNSQNVTLGLQFTQPVIDAAASGRVYFSFLGLRAGPMDSTRDNWDDPNVTPTNYRRAFGMRFNNNMVGAANDHDAPAQIGQGSTRVNDFSQAGRYGIDEWAIGNFGDVAYATSGANFHTEPADLIIGWYDGANETIRIIVNPNLDNVHINDGSVTATANEGRLSNNLWVALGLEAGNDGGGFGAFGAEFYFDEFRLGTSWEGVAIPEPSTYAMILGLLAAGVIVYRRRKA